MSTIGPEYAVVTFPDEIELCGVCGNRLYRLGPDLRPYCYHCGHGEERPTVVYVRAITYVATTP